ncbi:MAG TPA: hypothetical protein VGQ44_17200 [Gemmatimonadaceae bacterium]|jgi:hypothetical protein|nr:hypothetical protein [Gemmatimonadaceae bacterium]
MNDRETVSPALRADEWREIEPDLPTFGPAHREAMRALANSLHEANGGLLAKMIALANAALPVDDPRKFTHVTVDVLRQMPAFLRGAGMGADPDGAGRFISNLADVIESYLPPRP